MANLFLLSLSKPQPTVVTPHQNFDSLLIPEDHPSRSRSDNYFVREMSTSTVL